MLNDICVDIYNSINHICKQRLIDAGFKVPETTKYDYLSLLLNMKRRLVEPRKRTVHVHSKLRVPEKNSDGFINLVNKMKLGIDINGHQSHHLKRAEFNDDFLNDFGLHHFHLGTTNQKTGKYKLFIERTGNTVYAKVDQDDIYILGIYGHEKGETDLIKSDEELLKSLFDEWPHLLVKYRAIGARGHSLTPEERHRLRSSAANVITLLKDDIAILSPGGGYMSNNMSAAVYNEIMHLYGNLSKLKTLLFEIQEKNYPSNAYFRVVSFGHNELSLFCNRNCFFTKIEKLQNETKTVCLAPGYGPIYSHGFVPSETTRLYNSLISALNRTADVTYLHPFPTIYTTK
ncbi:hypothetical protein F3J38_27780 [Pantoea sp. Acro-805]|uniref:Uncharacterized protein n=1 Tax=Candidatus Pantoea formicae TaxID=2608355 RepID=A0ABX0R5E2_9GAMM|nr:hypothetical protein [Pantoea formicae]NIF03796.1 hypothetical protein [Pantoea formicae]